MHGEQKRETGHAQKDWNGTTKEQNKHCQKKRRHDSSLVAQCDPTGQKARQQHKY